MTTKQSDQQTWDDTQLMAWADGVLAADEATALEAAIEADAALAERAAAMLQTRSLVQQAYEAKLEAEPVPDALRESVLAMVARDRERREAEARAGLASRSESASGSVPGSVPGSASVSVPAPAQGGLLDSLRRFFAGFAMPQAVAATVVAGVVGFLAGQAGQGGGPDPGVRSGDGGVAGGGQAAPLVAAVGESASTALAALLDQLASGDEASLAERPLTMVASFRDRESRLCRDFSVAVDPGARVESVACREGDGGWRIAFSAVARDAVGFEPASSNSPVEAWLAGVGAGDPLDEAAERAALEATAGGQRD